MIAAWDFSAPVRQQVPISLQDLWSKDRARSVEGFDTRTLPWMTIAKQSAQALLLTISLHAQSLGLIVF